MQIKMKPHWKIRLCEVLKLLWIKVFSLFSSVKKHIQGIPLGKKNLIFKNTCIKKGHSFRRVIYYFSEENLQTRDEELSYFFNEMALGANSRKSSLSFLQGSQNTMHNYEWILCHTEPCVLCPSGLAITVNLAVFTWAFLSKIQI